MIGRRVGVGVRLLGSVLLCAVLLEGICQTYAAYLAHQWMRVREDPEHYFRASSNGILVYELKPGITLRKDGRLLQINRFGIREESDGTAGGMRKVALLGDSVVFGTGLSQDQTISALLQKKLEDGGTKVKVLNLGVPGYNLAEMKEQLLVKDGIYRVDSVIYLLNPNDFCWRDTVYEGADNGLYGMYHLPFWKTPWCLRKLVYRAHKGGLVSVRWYRWIYRGNRARGLEEIKEISKYCRKRHVDFLVVLLPAGCAYGDGTYLLTDMYDDLSGFLRRQGIRFVNPVGQFSTDSESFFTNTDHLQYAGNVLMAEVIARSLMGKGSVPVTGKGGDRDL